KSSCEASAAVLVTSYWKIIYPLAAPNFVQGSMVLYGEENSVKLGFITLWGQEKSPLPASTIKRQVNPGEDRVDLHFHETSLAQIESLFAFGKPVHIHQEANGSILMGTLGTWEPPPNP
ncbi:hypothetical protein, partial [Haloferula sp.]|uniref:hypothetical protein n=1 Tax=Haloferula sp. TaxID=2497595 RepID=UPI003C760E79